MRMQYREIEFRQSSRVVSFTSMIRPRGNISPNLNIWRSILGKSPYAQDSERRISTKQYRRNYFR